MATMKTMITVTRETQITTSVKGARTIGQLIDQHLTAELRMMTDDAGKGDSAFLSGISLTFDNEDADNLASMYLSRS